MLTEQQVDDLLILMGRIPARLQKRERAVSAVKAAAFSADATVHAALQPSEVLAQTYAGRAVFLGVSACRLASVEDPLQQPYWHPRTMRAILDALVAFQDALCTMARKEYPQAEPYAVIMAAHSTSRFSDPRHLTSFLEGFPPQTKQRLFQAQEKPVPGNEFTADQINACFELMRILWKHMNQSQVLESAERDEHRWTQEFSQRLVQAVPPELSSRFPLKTLREVESELGVATDNDDWLGQFQLECTTLTQKQKIPPFFSDLFDGALDYVSRHGAEPKVGAPAESHSAHLDLMSVIGSMLLLARERYLIHIEMNRKARRLNVYDHPSTRAVKLGEAALPFLKAPGFVICGISVAPFKSMAPGAVSGNSEGAHLAKLLDRDKSAAVVLRRASPPSSPDVAPGSPAVDPENLPPLDSSLRLNNIAIIVSKSQASAADAVWRKIAAGRCAVLGNMLFCPASYGDDQALCDRLIAEMRDKSDDAELILVSSDQAGRKSVTDSVKDHFTKNPPTPPRRGPSPARGRQGSSGGSGDEEQQVVPAALPEAPAQAPGLVVSGEPASEVSDNPSGLFGGRPLNIDMAQVAAAALRSPARSPTATVGGT